MDHLAPISGRRSWGLTELAALTVLVVGPLLLAFIGPLVGLVIVWLSRRWTVRDKAIASVIAGSGSAAQLLLLFMPSLWR